jgi:hypothetical protein
MRKTGMVAAAVVVATLAARTLLESPPIPDPATDAMEPQVREKLVSAREAVMEDIGSSDAWGRLGMVFHAHYLETEATPCYASALLTP